LLEECNYYPYGLIFDQNQAFAGLTSTNYLYNGKELQQNEFGAGGNGLSLYDYGARMYDVQIGRWTQVDELASKYESWTPYQYVRGNPVGLMDPDGKGDSDFKDKDGNLVAHHDDGSNAVYQQTGEGTTLHYAKTDEKSKSGGTDAITPASQTSVLEEQQKLNIKNPALQQGNGMTHCNQATQNIQRALGSALDKDLLVSGNANTMATSMATNANYKAVDAATAEKTAQSGGLAILAFKNPVAGRSGHMATFSVGANIKLGQIANVGLSYATGFVPAADSPKAVFTKTDYTTNVKFYILK
jgi:RHS repeat-associated protein